MKLDGAEVVTVGDAFAWLIAHDYAADADGAAHAYAPKDSGLRGLDFLQNATRDPKAPISSSTRWVGVVTDNGADTGTPIVQGAGDPAPGFYVSPTSLTDPTRPRTSPARYVDAERFPFVAIGGKAKAALGLEPGDLAWVVDTRDGTQSGAIFADVAPGESLHEGSIALLKALGWPGSPRGGAAPRPGDLAVVVWPGSRATPAWPRPDYLDQAAARFAQWGGLPRLRSALNRPDIPDGPVSGGGASSTVKILVAVAVAALAVTAIVWLVSR